MTESGVGSWPDTCAGAVRLWLHPSDWPETFAGQTRRVVTVALFAITAVTALLLRASAPSGTLTADVRHPATSLWLALILAGAALAAPFPHLRWDWLVRLATLAIRTLAAPAAALLALFLTANSGLIGRPTGIAHDALVFCYWATLGFTALRTCTLIARAARIVTLPTTRRLRAALLLIGAGLALAAGQSLLASVQATPHAGPVTVSLVLGVFATATIRAGHDLHGSSA